MRTKGFFLFTAVLAAALLSACGQPTPASAPIPSPSPQKSPTAAPAAAQQEDQTAFHGKWVNEQSGYTLVIKNGQYRLTEPKKLFIMAGDCKSGGVAKLLCGDYTVALQNGTLTVGGIDGEFTYTKVYDGGAGDEFLGEWENDTTDYKLTVTATDCTFSSLSEYSVSSSSYAAEASGLYIGSQDEDARIETAPDGGLKATGYDGTFYRVGLGKGAPSRFIPYWGEWANDDGVSLSIQEGAYFIAGEDVTMSMGGCWIGDDGVLMIGDEQTITLNADGTLSVWSIEGTFKKTGEYTPPAPSATLRPAPTPSPKPRRQHENRQYGLMETSPSGLTFLEPETGSRITLPGLLAQGLIRGEMDTQNGPAYMLISSPVPEDEFSILGSQITAMGAVSFSRIGATGIEDVILHFNDPDFDSFRVMEQSKNHVLLCEYDTSGETPRQIYKWGYLFDDGGVLGVQLTVDEDDAAAAGEVVVEPGAEAAQGEALLAPSAPAEAAADGVKAAGWGLVIGAWYSEEQDAAIVCNADGTAALTNSGGDKLQASYTVFYGEGFDNTPRLRLDTEGDTVDAMLVGGTLTFEQEQMSFVRVPVESLPEHLK